MVNWTKYNKKINLLIMEDSIFTKIIKKEIPCHLIFEDDKTIAFMDIHPVTDGHVLVVSKTQVEYVWDLDDEDYMALMRTVKRVALRLREVMKKPYVGESIVGTDVPHAHIHVIPFNETLEMKRTLENATLPTDHDKLAELAEKLKF